MDEPTRTIREHLIRLLGWEDAHVGFDTATEAWPAEARGVRPDRFQHSPWQLVEHIRLAQQDILDFCVNASYAHALTWPDDYWPASEAPPHEGAWDASLAACRRSREALEQLVRDVPVLAAPVPTGEPHQTYLRAILLAADHAAYHVGQLVVVRRALGVWHR